MNLRGLLWLLLAVQAGGVLVIAAALHFWLGAGAWLALAIGVACAVLVRLAINANNFLMSAFHGSPTPAHFSLGPLGRLRLFGREFGASMLAASWHMVHSRAAARIYPDSTALPVLLLHGYGANSGFWVHLAARLDAARISHATVDLEPLGCGIDDYLPMVDEAARALCQASGSARLVVVGHSMGGLVARAWLRRDHGVLAARLITLGTPHHGTRLAGLAPGANGQQMRRRRGAQPESAWLRELAAGEDDATRALITSIWSHHDNIVAPQTSSMLPGARNIEFGGVGHVALGSDPAVLDAVMREIAAASGQNG